MTSVEMEMVGMSEDVMSSSEFAALVRESTLRAVHGGRVQSPPAERTDDAIIVGSGVRAMIEHAVVKTIKELLGRHVLLSGPLRELSERLEAAHRDANELRDALREVEGMLAQAQAQDKLRMQPVIQTPVAAAVVQTPASEPATAEPAEAKLLPAVVPARVTSLVVVEYDGAGQKRCAKCRCILGVPNRSRRNPAYCMTCLPSEPVDVRVTASDVVATTDEKPSDKTEVVDVRATAADDDPAEITPADVSLEPVWVNGIKVTFNKRTHPAFVRFFREFVVELRQKPVCGRLAYAKAQSYGFPANAGTFLVNIQNRIGELDKKPDPVTGESMWSLPGWTGTAS